VLARSFTSSVAVTAVYRCFGGANCGTARTITLAPRESRLISDVIGTLFGVPESGGAIELSWDTFNGPLTARTRLFTPSSPPSYGFGVAGEPSTAATARAAFIGVAGSADLSKAFHYLVRAGDRAEALFAHHEARAYYQRALRVLPPGPETTSWRRSWGDGAMKLVNPSPVTLIWSLPAKFVVTSITRVCP